MPKTNQIPYLSPSRRTPGATYHWKPSPRLRRHGFQNVKLGNDWDQAVIAALAQNESVARWIRANVGVEGSASAPRKAPKIMRWRDLVDAYKADPAYLDLKPKSRAEYDSRIRFLDAWAVDGTLRLDDLNREIIVTLRNALVKDRRKHRTAALLRVLRVIVNFGAGQSWLPRGLVDGLDIPEAGSRKTIVSPADVERLACRAEAMEEPTLALAIRLALWTFQRESDLLSLTRFQWREMGDVSFTARRVLGGDNGKVMGFRLQQRKTDAWVHVPPPPPLRDAVIARMGALDAAEAHLIGRGGSGEAWPGWAFQRAFQRAFRRVCAAEGMDHVQFRDLRRSGMVMFGELAVPLPMITAGSGHTVLGQKKTILDTYMPGNARMAAEGVAIAWSRWRERSEAEQQDEAK